MKKKKVFWGTFLTLFYFIIWMFSCGFAEAEASPVAERYTALVLDLSGSMSGTPITELREAAKKFCEQVINAQGANYVAILTLEGNVATDFSNVSSKLTQAINEMRGSSSDPTQGLKKAKDLFDSNYVSDEETNAVRNIIVMSDGQPGNTTPATVAAQELWPNHKIYSLGFFHSISGTSKTKAEEFLRGLQNAGFYEVLDGEQLDFAFNDIAGDITGDNKKPIIYVPGIMGSDLYDPETRSLVWLPIGGIPIIGHDWTGYMEIDHVLGIRPPDDPDYFGTWDSSKEIVTRLRKEFPNRDVYFFAYDWRRGSEYNASRLGIFANTLDTAKVDIVAHSMGGLVASSYFKMPNSKIDKIITLATPYEGSNDAITRALSDTKVLNMGSVDGVVSDLAKLTPGIKRAYPALAQLAPTLNYHSKMPMRKFDILRSPISYGPSPYDPLSTSEFDRVLKNTFPLYKSGEEIIDIVSQAKNFHNSIHQSDGYNALLGYDNAYFVWGTGQQTVEYLFVGKDTLSPVYLQYTNNGDETVPYFSASIMGQVEKLPSWRWHTFNDTHLGIVKNEGAINWVISVLKNSVSDVESEKYNRKPYTTIRVACPVDVEINSNGESLSSKENAFNDSTSFGRLDIIGENGDIKMLCLDDGAFQVTMNGTGTGNMDYSVAFYDQDDNLIKGHVFSDVYITDKTIITTDTDKSKTPTLNVDENGDGIVDQSLSPDSGNFQPNPDDGNDDIEPVIPNNPSNPITPSVPDPVVVQPTGITFENGQATFALTLKNGSESVLSVKISPDNATETQLTWKSSNTKVATIEPLLVASTRSQKTITALAAEQSAKLKAVGSGTATITVSTSNGFSASGTVTVTPDIVNETPLTIDLSQLSLQNGTLKLKAGETVDATISSNPAGASFKATGLPTGLTLSSAGRLSGSTDTEGTFSVVVEATLNGTSKTASFKIEVTSTGKSTEKPNNSSGGGCSVNSAAFAVLAALGVTAALKKREKI